MGTSRSAHTARLLGGLSFLLAACHFDRADRWEDTSAPVATPAPGCTPGALRCGSSLERCGDDGKTWSPSEDCAGEGLVCSSKLLRCASCDPGAHSCANQTVVLCRDDGSGTDPTETCDLGAGIACRSGICTNLCGAAAALKSNVGCEYWGVDLDNAMVDATLNAASQQYAIVVSNPQPDIVANVTIEQDDSDPGSAARIKTAATGTVLPQNLSVFKLGPREVDGSADGTFNSGSGTATTRHAYRITSSVPIVAYQFNPLDNVNVFSNDASLLMPVEALWDQGAELHPSYVVVGWPQTIASTDDPDTNFDPFNPTDLRAFVTIVGTRPGTHVKFTTAAKVVAGGSIATTPVGGVIERTLDPFDVLNLESGGFNADFTGSTIMADAPVVVYSGSEASDAPYYQKLADRRCCADHLEEQLFPVRTAGTDYVLAHTPSRTAALVQAGAVLGVVDEPEFFRVVAATDRPTTVTTSLPPPDDTFTLDKMGAFHELVTLHDAVIHADAPVLVGDVQASQEAAGVRRGLPGGDPSLVIVPPIEQYRASYVFLTPDKYAFDFILVVAPPDATVLLDQRVLDDTLCETRATTALAAADAGSPASAPWTVYRCQLSFPTIDPSLSAPDNLSPGDQNDGVHIVQSDRAVGVLVFGFDSFVSYGYAAGTELETINVE